MIVGFKPLHDLCYTTANLSSSSNKRKGGHPRKLEGNWDSSPRTTDMFAYVTDTIAYQEATLLWIQAHACVTFAMLLQISAVSLSFIYFVYLFVLFFSFKYVLCSMYLLVNSIKY